MDADAYLAVLEIPDLETGEVEREYLVSLQQPEVHATTVGEQGPAGRPGVDGATISPDQDNQIQNRPNGLYVPPAEWVGADW